ncbi:MAG: hypothetical protein ACXWZ1_05830 [Gaiellaceae bacterium]
MSETTAATALHDIDQPTGPVAAAVLAAGIGIFILGLLTTLSEASVGVKDFLDFYDRVGPLSGKTILASAAYLGSWAILHALWRRQNRELRPILIATVVLIVLGILGTFPTFFQAFA